MNSEMTPTKHLNHYTEAQRYLTNAMELLSTKAQKLGSHYQDPKYVKMACGTAYNGVLIALDAYLALKGKPIRKRKTERKSVDDYRSVLATIDKKVLTTFNDTYEILHLLGYYDGNTNVKVIKVGLDSAQSIINKIKPPELPIAA